MKRLCPAFLCAVLFLPLVGCVTVHEHDVTLTGNLLVDGPMMISNGPPQDRVLWEYRTAAAALRHGDDPLARQVLDDAITRLGGIYGPDKSAQKARSYFHAERVKNYIGEPYERVMAYYYRGILYWMDGEPDNARACFRSGQIEDSSSEGEQYAADYVILDYLDGLATTKLGDDGSDAFARAKKEARLAKPPPYDPNANVLFFLEFGPGPVKYATGEYREELRFLVRRSPVHSVRIIVDDQTVVIRPWDDLGFQATTRGGRVMDHVLKNKAVFKSTTSTIGTIGMIAGAETALAGAQSHNSTAGEVGLGLLAAGIITQIVSASVTPHADTRAWDNLPRYLTFTALSLPPGPHTATVEFLNEIGDPFPGLTKTITINVPADKQDKVVFVSDQSATPQTI
jgi:hypothetical protein